MPQPRKHVSNAQRQAEYRRRRLSEPKRQSSDGLPSLPKVAAIPATARWRKAITQAQVLLELVQNEMQHYYDDRTEIWQESDKGNAFQERTDALTEIQDQVSNLLSDW
jgi:hypothetical protein